MKRTRLTREQGARRETLEFAAAAGPHVIVVRRLQ